MVAYTVLPANDGPSWWANTLTIDAARDAPNDGQPATYEESGAIVRVDIESKATGQAIYVGDIHVPGMAHASVVRSDVPHGLIRDIDLSGALAIEGVIGAYVAEDVTDRTFGRGVKDIPVLARKKVRYVGEPVAAVVAETREIAETAAQRVFIDYEPLTPILDPLAATDDSSELVHGEAWAYPDAAVTQSNGPNLQSVVRGGHQEAATDSYETAPLRVDATYTTPAGHAGYLEPQVCIANVTGSSQIEVWATNKAPYRIRSELARLYRVDEPSITFHPTPIGGDFGGKGPLSHIPLCVELARLSGRPVKLALRYSEDLIAGSPRHATRIRVRLGADESGRLLSMLFEILADGGAYAGAKPARTASIRGFQDPGSCYRIPDAFFEAKIAYTNSVPRGHVREPGGPQVTFALESALDELAHAAGITPLEIRLRNLLRDNEPNPHGHQWAEVRAIETMMAAHDSAIEAPADMPEGWVRGIGLGICSRVTLPPARTSVRLIREGERVVAEVPIPETGTGSHTVVQRAVSELLRIRPEQVSVRPVSTDGLPYDQGVGGSRVTVSMISAVADAARQLLGTGEESAIAETSGSERPVISFCAQVAQVAVDPATGEFEVLRLTTAVDVARIINPVSHQMQIDGGALMGYGFACLEDLHLTNGQVYASNLGEFKIPSPRDAPELQTVLVEASQGIGPLQVKNVGELSNAAVGAAIAGAIFDATDVRLRDLPLTSESIWRAMTGGHGRTVVMQ